MADNRISIPQSGGGLIRYTEDYKSKIEMSPQMVIVLIILVIVIEAFLHTKGFGLF